MRPIWNAVKLVVAPDGSIVSLEASSPSARNGQPFSQRAPRVQGSGKLSQAARAVKQGQWSKAALPKLLECRQQLESDIEMNQINIEKAQRRGKSGKNMVGHLQKVDRIQQSHLENTNDNIAKRGSPSRYVSFDSVRDDAASAHGSVTSAEDDFDHIVDDDFDPIVDDDFHPSIDANFEANSCDNPGSHDDHLDNKFDCNFDAALDDSATPGMQQDLRAQSVITAISQWDDRPRGSSAHTCKKTKVDCIWDKTTELRGE
ncbi:hypothetical protein E8E14_000965 [Neopestalotiopsis sp. 37M]|nr:hypothetical protein E8E14_000965 [Neopestalotiopsis sp. 37M]